MALIANNTRFLILPGYRIPHLASRVLGLNLRLPEVTMMTITDKRLDDLWLRLNGIPEHRCRRGIRHGKISILAVAICALVSNAQRIAAIAEWAGRCPQRILRRLGCRRDPRTKRYVPPSEPTVRRFLQQVDPVPKDAASRGWVDLTPAAAVAVDGKEIRGASKAGSTKVRLLGPFLQSHGVTTQVAKNRSP